MFEHDTKNLLVQYIYIMAWYALRQCQERDYVDCCVSVFVLYIPAWFVPKH